LNQLKEPYDKYYAMATSIILGDHESNESEEDEEMFQVTFHGSLKIIYLYFLNLLIEIRCLKTILDDFRTNGKLQPVLPYLIHFISQAVYDKQIQLIDFSSNETFIYIIARYKA
jgi:hypothetical protein